MKKIWKDILAIGALSFIASELESAQTRADDLEKERDELQSQLDEMTNGEEWESEN